MTQQSTTAVPPRRRWLRPGIAVAAVILALLGLWQVALARLEQRVRNAFGPEAELRDVSVDWPGIVVVDDLRLKAPEGWPAKETLRAQRVEVVPALRSVFSERIVVEAVRIDGAYLSVLRRKDGNLKFLPTLFERADRGNDPGKRDDERRRVTIDEVELQHATLDFYDASVEDELVRLQLVDVEATVEDIRVPERDGRTAVDMNGVVKGHRDDEGKVHDGRFSLKGWLEVATRNSDLDIALEDVDLQPLEPYLLRRSETGVKRGRMDMKVSSQVRDRHLKAPGKLVLKDLKLEPGKGLRSTFMGMPREAVITTLKSGKDRITLDFTLEGELGSTRFSLNETLAVRVAVGAAQSLGIGLVDIVKGVGSFGGEALEATGDAIGKLFGADGDDDEDADKKP